MINFDASAFFSSLACSFIMTVIVLTYLRKKRIKSKVLLRNIEDVSGGEKIIATVQFNNKDTNGVESAYYQNVTVDVLNNNPIARKMFVRMWLGQDGEGNMRYTDRVFSYSDHIFKHFTTLNPVKPIMDTKGMFEDELKVAIQREKYEEAAIIRDAINKLKKLKNK